MANRRYPKIHIRSKNELAKHICGGFSYNKALALIKDVCKNHSRYWKDSVKYSKPEEQKYVRNAKGTPLGKLLEEINRKVLAPHDSMLPNFIFGGISGRNHVGAVRSLLGSKRKRTLLGLDITRFFEQVSEDRVCNFFQKKCECSCEAAQMLARLCCVPKGPKGSGRPHKTLARGFSTSSRLAVWCNLDTFIKLDYLVKKRLKGKDPRLAIYVDDIGITASRVTESEMEKLYLDIEKLFLEGDRNQPLPLNNTKKKIITHEKTPEHLGIKMLRNKLRVGNRTQGKINRVKSKLMKTLPTKDRAHAKNKKKSLHRYKRYVEGK